MEEEKLKQILVGPKLDKFEKKVFSIPAFFFGGIYFAYRKMIIHAIIVLLVTGIVDTLAMKIDFGLMIITILCIHISIGLYFPLWYRKFYNNKIKSILSKGLSGDDQIREAQKAGGTSIGLIIIAIVANTVIANTVNGLGNKVATPSSAGSLNTSASTNNNNNNNSNKNAKNKSKDKKNETTSNGNTLIEDVKISASSGINGTYTFYVGYDDDQVEYTCKLKNADIINSISDYDELSINLYCTEDNEIVDFEIINKETKEPLENIETVNDIREALGYFAEGEHEEELTLVELSDTPGAGFKDNISYTYYDCTFESQDGKQLEGSYKIYENDEDKSNLLTVGNKYKVKFNVEIDSFDNYENTITDFEQI